ncbi:MAG: formylglycine-generating enzyme family protein [Treponema sp.]|jgi:formylglycine-generating enzyme required for sulfatase activity|nr:formylglycine-generating enzyme family protein [Treponema sp.]
MKNHIKFLAGLTLAFCLAQFLTSCLNALEFDGNTIRANVNLTGDIATTDITSAVLILSNRSKTVDVKSVTITQPDWEPPAANPRAQPPFVSFDNKPKRLEKKAQYLVPSDRNYRIVINYAFDAYKSTPAGTGTVTLSVPLPLPRQVVELFIFRNSSGVVIIDRDTLDADPNDLGNPAEDPLVGEGSSPAVIPPVNRTKIATFVVISKTNSQIIDSVNFKTGDSSYTMGRIAAKDKQSIALGQGTWETTLKYTLNGLQGMVGPLNSVIVPSNDPQAIREHYLYFYKNTHGNYSISQEWPPFPNDVDEEDVLPPDLFGQGRGLIKVDNKSYGLVTDVIIYNLQEKSRNPLLINYRNFAPPVPVQYGKIGYVDVVGTSEFPIDPHGNYLIEIYVEINGQKGIVRRQAYIKDQVITITVNPGDIVMSAPNYGKCIINFETYGAPPITGMTIINKDYSDRILYVDNQDFCFAGETSSTGHKHVNIIGSSFFPLEDHNRYNILFHGRNGFVSDLGLARIKDRVLSIEIRPAAGTIIANVEGAWTVPLAPGSPIGLELVLLDGGTFTMGSPGTEPERQPNETLHTAIVSSFYMGKYPVTQKQYRDVMGYNPSFFAGDNLPVEMVTWFDAVEFSNKLSTMNGLQPVYTIKGRSPVSGYPIRNAEVSADWTKNGYRLPTEAEWEYACRAGTSTAFYDDMTYITTDYANFNGIYPYNAPTNLSGLFRAKTTVVNAFPPNSFGLYDMHGNVDEWCWDWYGHYPIDGILDYTGPASGTYRISRSGSWISHGRDLRSAHRFAGDTPGSFGSPQGFRVALPK